MSLAVQLIHLHCKHPLSEDQIPTVVDVDDVGRKVIPVVDVEVDACAVVERDYASAKGTGIASPELAIAHHTKGPMGVEMIAAAGK